MAEELTKLTSAFRSLGDEDEDKSEEIPLDESLDDDKNSESGSSDDEEEQF